MKWLKNRRAALQIVLATKRSKHQHAIQARFILRKKGCGFVHSPFFIEYHALFNSVILIQLQKSVQTTLE